MLAEDGHERHTTDIAKLNDEYRLVVTANPTVPVLRIYAVTGDKRTAAALANAAVDATSKRLTNSHGRPARRTTTRSS